jgi:hypothetical protein
VDLPDIEQYAQVMKEIKLRTAVIDLFLTGQRDARYIAATVETIGLQFRKIFELIAFASLAANRPQYAAAYSDFAKHWEAAKLLRKLREINPNFYPRPIIELPSKQPGIVSEFKDREQDYLTQDDLIVAHGRCGVLMHGANPFGQSINYGYYQRSFPIWKGRIVNLLNSHQVHLPDDPGFYLFHMKEVADDEVHWYRFQPPSIPVDSH